MIKEQELKDIFRQYNLDLIKEFANIFLPVPVSGNYSYFKIKTADNFTFYVWGKNTQDILNKFERFLGLQIFL